MLIGLGFVTFALIFAQSWASSIEQNPSRPFFSCWDTQKIKQVKARPFQDDFRSKPIALAFHRIVFGMGSPPVRGFFIVLSCYTSFLNSIRPMLVMIASIISGGNSDNLSWPYAYFLGSDFPYFSDPAKSKSLNLLRCTFSPAFLYNLSSTQQWVLLETSFIAVVLHERFFSMSLPNLIKSFPSLITTSCWPISSWFCEISKIIGLPVRISSGIFQLAYPALRVSMAPPLFSKTFMTKRGRTPKWSGMLPGSREPLKSL